MHALLCRESSPDMKVLTQQLSHETSSSWQHPNGTINTGMQPKNIKTLSDINTFKTIGKVMCGVTNNGHTMNYIPHTYIQKASSSAAKY